MIQQVLMELTFNLEQARDFIYKRCQKWIVIIEECMRDKIYIDFNKMVASLE